MKRVLIVDDEVGTRQSLKAIFSGTYDVLLASGAHEARTILDEGLVDLILVENFDDEAMDALCRYEWPGNVRELHNIVERMVVLNRLESIVTFDLLPDDVRKQARPADDTPLNVDGLSLEEAISRFERRLIESALRNTGGVQTRAAQRLGTMRRILRYKMEKLHIYPQSFTHRPEPTG